MQHAWIRTLAAMLPAALATAAFASPPLDLTGWSLWDPDGNWGSTNPSATSVRLDEQAASTIVHPGWVLSDFALPPSATIEFNLQVAAGTGDDDLIGFGFSFVSAVHSYLLDWKKATQTVNWGQSTLIADDTAEMGLKIKRINGGFTWDGLWGGADGLGVSTIAGPVGEGWVAGVTYHFIVQLAPGHIVVWRDAALMLDVQDSTYPGGYGLIALYGFSQDNIILSNVQVTPTPTTCTADLNSDGVVDGGDLGQLLAAWATNDPVADLNGSGEIDGADLGVLLGAWGNCP